MTVMKLFEDDNYYFKVYEPLSEEDETKIQRINKATKKKEWINLSDDDIWAQLENAKEIDNFDFEVNDDYIK